MIEDRKAELKAEITRRERELAKLEALPDFGELAEGTVMALNVTLGRSRPYVYIAYKSRDRWYVTGERSPNRATSDQLAAWLVSSGRRLETAVVLAEIEAVRVPSVDLSALLSAASDKVRRDQYANAWDRKTGQGEYADRDRRPLYSTGTGGYEESVDGYTGQVS
jgi:hypothetical protein